MGRLPRHPEGQRMTCALGKTPARPGAVSFRLATYATALPTPPPAFGHYAGVAGLGSMLGNDRYGDCVWAGAAHETILWTDEGTGLPAVFTDATVLSDYAAVTGFSPDDPNSDRGTDMEVAAKYRRQTGVIDTAGKRHQVAAYLAITAGDVAEHLTAAYVFGAVGIGINFPSSAMDQFNAGQPWDVVKGSRIEGGHYVPLVGADEQYLYVLTWGKVQRMTRAFLKKYNDESIVYLSAEALKDGQSPEGFDIDQLKADLAALGNPTPDPAPTPPPDPFDAVITALRKAWAPLDAWLRGHGL